MEHLTNKLVRDLFVRCDYNAWEQVSDLWTDTMQGWLNYYFKNLPEAERYEIIPKFQVKFFEKVKAAHKEAEIEIHNAQGELSMIEIEAIRIRHCTTKTRFDLSHGSRFENWMWKCLVNEARNELNRHKIRPDNVVEIDKDFAQYEQFSELQIPPDQGELRSTIAIKETLKTVLEGNERIYLELWFNAIKPDAPPDPDASDVKAAIKDKTGETVEDDYVARLKKNFLAKAYLELIEHNTIVNSLASLFRRLAKINRIHDLMFEIMMKNIWRDFYEDKVAVRKSTSEISKELWAKWETLKLRKAVQEKILIEAYRYYRVIRPPRRFCWLINLYADNHFGSKIREIFMRGGK